VQFKQVVTMCRDFNTQTNSL